MPHHRGGIGALALVLGCVPAEQGHGAAETETGSERGSTSAQPPPAATSTGEDVYGTSGTTGADTSPATSAAASSSGASGSTGSPVDCLFVQIVDLGGDTLNVRSAPMLESEVVGTLVQGQVVAVLGEVVGGEVSDPGLGTTELWYEIEGAGTTGFVTALYAECAEAPPEQEWVWPVPLNPVIGQDYGNPIQYQSCGFHTGLDIGGAIGDPIVAVADGVVVHVGPMWYDGPGQGRGPYAIIVQHGEGPLYSTYGHNDAALVTEGEIVTAGDPIAELGTLGYSSGPHLHFEMLEGTPFTEDWQVPFENACDHYRDPKDYVQP